MINYERLSVQDHSCNPVTNFVTNKTQSRTKLYLYREVPLKVQLLLGSFRNLGFRMFFGKCKVQHLLADVLSREVVELTAILFFRLIKENFLHIVSWGLCVATSEQHTKVQ